MKRYKLYWKSPIRKGVFVHLGNLDLLEEQAEKVKKALKQLNFYLEMRSN